MEAASIAYVASHFGTPLLVVKSITDIVDGERATGAPPHQPLRADTDRPSAGGLLGGYAQQPRKQLITALWAARHTRKQLSSVGRPPQAQAA